MQKLWVVGLALLALLIGIGALWHIRAQRRAEYLGLVYQVDRAYQECRRAASTIADIWESSGAERLAAAIADQQDFYPEFARAKEADRLIDPALRPAKTRSKEEQQLIVEAYAIQHRVCQLAQWPEGESMISLQDFLSKSGAEFDRKMTQVRFLADAPPTAPAGMLTAFSGAIETAGLAASNRASKRLAAAKAVREEAERQRRQAETAAAAQAERDRQALETARAAREEQIRKLRASMPPPLRARFTLWSVIDGKDLVARMEISNFDDRDTTITARIYLEGVYGSGLGSSQRERVVSLKANTKLVFDERFSGLASRSNEIRLTGRIAAAQDLTPHP